tara:strand:+ start:181 stop:609 length:429 start_codon:yes stop_codon:yes gene_type:complete
MTEEQEQQEQQQTDILFTLLESKPIDWQKFEENVNEQTSKHHKDNVYPLHLALKENADFEIVNKVIEAYPQAILKRYDEQNKYAHEWLIKNIAVKIENVKNILSILKKYKSEETTTQFTEYINEISNHIEQLQQKKLNLINI